MPGEKAILELRNMLVEAGMGRDVAAAVLETWWSRWVRVPLYTKAVPNGEADFYHGMIDGALLDFVREQCINRDRQQLPSLPALRAASWLTVISEEPLASKPQKVESPKIIL
jgi:hypothetical protein